MDFQALDAPAFGVLDVLGPDQPMFDVASFSGGAYGTAAWPAASLALYMPIEVVSLSKVTKVLWENGATVSGNADVGLYRLDGARIVSTGSTAIAGTSVAQSPDITDTEIPPGNYYLAMAVDNTTALIGRATCGALIANAGGAKEESVFPLPSTAAWSPSTRAYIPHISLLTRADGL